MPFPQHQQHVENVSQKLLYSLGRTIIRIYTRMMLKLDILWQAPLPAGPKLIVANHPSASDPFYLALLSPRPIKILIIDNPFAVPVLGAYLRRSGHVPVIPGNGRLAFEQARRLLETGRSVALFPEGWISPQQGGFNSPRTGAARLALLTDVPVVPVGIYLPRARNRTITAHINGKHTVGYWYLRGPYSMTVGHALHFEGDCGDRACVTFVTNSIMRQITALAHQSEQRTTGCSPLPRYGLGTKDLAYTPVHVQDEDQRPTSPR
jgi:1-acyl-sn-glycerol-3-phosphate acyltransferase